eukprot:CAMPEP_0179360940 /NCGR_PEP_ID=MMETSP0797-20121207/80236_1 /TAXON_ID=47934 /ORGANISM="Dinophysis acuminata, Strain DAEP01" /LENGTH=409 /DNA_ID=CAMNT_0021076311 /DNA_START=89 /DNA_END=1319 /DNA_ORIENTATION=+
MGQQISEMAQPYSDMAMLCVSPVAPHTRKESTYGWSQSLGLVWGASGMQGLRERMEDAHLTIPSVQSADEHWNGSGLFGVMDGHGGEQVANFFQKHAPSQLVKRPGSHRDVSPGRRDGQRPREPRGVALDDQRVRRRPTAEAPRRQLEARAPRLGRLHRRSVLHPEEHARRGERRGQPRRALPGGEGHRHVRGPQAEPAEGAGEDQKAGGQVFEKQVGKHTVYRVNGDLSLSRALGDFRFKQNPRLAPKDQMISCVPDVQTVKLQPEDEFMVLACDGVWDALGSQEVVDYIRPHLPSIVSGSVPPSAVVEGLLDYCFWPDLAQNRGMGTDNMTMVLVVFAHDRPVKVWGVPRKEGAAMGFPFKAAGMPGVAGKGPVGVPGTMRTGQVGGAGRRRPSAEHTAKGANQFAI